MKMKNPNLTNEEVCRLAKSGDPYAVEILISNNIGFIKTIAKDIYSQFIGFAEFDELVEEGQIAIWKCITKFQEESGANFLTYAKSAVRNAMLDYIRKLSSEISFDDFAVNEESVFSGFLTDIYSKTPEQILIKEETIKELYTALHKLENRECTYLIYRFGLNDGHEHSVSDTAFHFSLSESRAKSVEKEALQKMRKLMFL